MATKRVPKKIIPASQAKASFLDLLRRVQELREAFTITRRGEPAGVLLGIEEYESLIETLEIMSDPRLMRAIRRGLRDIAQGRVHTHEEVFGG